MSDSRPGAVTDAHRLDLSHETVVCLGSSTTASKGTYKWIDELAKRPQNTRFRFVNFGVGGDLSCNTVGLLDRVVALQPDRVIVLIGGNDIMASLFPNVRRFVRVWKRLSDEPSPARFEENLNFIVRKLRRGGNPRIGLSSLAPIGEDPDSRDPVQARLNDLTSTYNDIIAHVASNERTDYIPFGESFQRQLANARTSKAFTHFAFGSFYRDYLLREMILRRSFDEISRMNGWHFHIDGIHLNSNGGRILVEVVQQFLDS
jgi:lysophospholipase L1-like esterase